MSVHTDFYTVKSVLIAPPSSLNALVVNSLIHTPEWYGSDGVLHGGVSHRYREDSGLTGASDAFSSDDYARIEGIDPDPQILLGTRLMSDWKCECS